MYLRISVRSTGRESTKLQQLNEHSIQGPRHETSWPKNMLMFYSDQSLRAMGYNLTQLRSFL